MSGRCWEHGQVSGRCRAGVRQASGRCGAGVGSAGSCGAGGRGPPPPRSAAGHVPTQVKQGAVPCPAQVLTGVPGAGGTAPRRSPGLPRAAPRVSALLHQPLTSARRPGTSPAPPGHRPPRRTGPADGASVPGRNKLASAAPRPSRRDPSTAQRDPRLSAGDAHVWGTCACVWATAPRAQHAERPEARAGAGGGAGLRMRGWRSRGGTARARRLGLWTRRRVPALFLGLRSDARLESAVSGCCRRGHGEAEARAGRRARRPRPSPSLACTRRRWTGRASLPAPLPTPFPVLLPVRPGPTLPAACAPYPAGGTGPDTQAAGPPSRGDNSASPCGVRCRSALDPVTSASFLFSLLFFFLSSK